MGYNIKFSVHRNPQKDSEGNDTYQVRHETSETVGKAYFLRHLRNTNLFRPELMEAALTVLEQEIINQLTDNLRLHLEGLGTFYLKLKFRPRYDEYGNEQRIQFTDPAKITGNDVCIDSVGFTPDRQFLKQLHEHGYHFVNATGRGRVGHSTEQTEEQVKMRLDQWFSSHEMLTCRQMMGLFGITRYMANKWLDSLCVTPSPYLYPKKIGGTVCYYRHTKK